MDCLECRESLSARIDGETETAAAERVDGHLRGCGPCGEWSRRAEELTRSLRIRPAAPIPDLSRVILEDAPVAATTRGWWARGALAAVAVAQIGLGLSQLLGVTGAQTGHGPVMASHLFNESTAWNLALGLGLFWAVFRPRATSGLIPVLAAFVVVLFAYSTHDLVTGSAPVPRVVGHGLLVAGLCLLIVVDRRSGAPAPDDVRAGGAGSEDGTAGRSPTTRADDTDDDTDDTGPAGRPHLRPASRHRAA